MTVPVWVLVEAVDGPVFVPHTQSEVERLFRGVDVEASWAASGPLENDNDKGDLMSATPAPTDTYANKALVSALGTVVLVALRWAVSDEFQLADEGLITLAGAVTTLAVYAVSNFRRLLGLRSERGYALVEVLLVVFLVLVILLVLFRLA